MDEVANGTVATGIEGFIQRLYDPLIVWANGFFATKTEVAAIAGANLSIADDEDAEAIWEDYTFGTTD